MSSILVDPAAQNSGSEQQVTMAQPTAAGWVVEKVNKWEEHRHNNYDKRWDEYYRMWRGVWSPLDKNRQVERSRIVSPALQQAIESSVAEMEESVFHRERWFDLDDDVYDETPGDMPEVVTQTLDDFKRKKVPDSIREIILNGALYGTGIGKIVVEAEKPLTIVKEPAEALRVGVSVVPVDPREFVIDPAATKIDNALGCAHIYTVPLHDVLQKQADGVYLAGPVGLFDDATEVSKTAEIENKPRVLDQVEIVEYHGLIPKGLYNDATKGKKLSEQDQDLLALSVLSEEDQKQDTKDRDGFIEATVWIANRGTLLRISANPFLMKDRSFISFQYDTVPGKFWGRGVAEKGYNPQKALDAEMRARIDGLALSTYPMLLINGLVAPRNQDYQVRPGRNIVVNGDVGQAMAPFKFPGPDQNSHQHTSDMERMVTVATGSLDSAAPLGVNPRNETASGISMMLSSVLKRSKRTLRNIESQLLSPMVHKVVWRYMQFDPKRYAQQDYEFRVIGALGAQAREFEVAQLTQLIQTQEQGSPGYYMILKGILRNYNIEDKEELMKLIDQAIEQALNPPEPPPDPEIEIKKAKQALDEAKFQFEQDKAVENEDRKDLEVEAEAARDRGESIWNGSEAVLNVAKAQTEKVKALGALVQQLAAAQGTEGVDMQALLGQAEIIIEEADQEMNNSPEIDALRESMTRQQTEESDRGVT
jgi:hypothetical protein